MGGTRGNFICAGVRKNLDEVLQESGLASSIPLSGGRYWERAKYGVTGGTQDAEATTSSRLFFSAKTEPSDNFRPSARILGKTVTLAQVQVTGDSTHSTLLPSLIYSPGSSSTSHTCAL